MHAQDSSLLTEQAQPPPSGPLLRSLGEPQLSQLQQPRRQSNTCISWVSPALLYLLAAGPFHFAPNGCHFKIKLLGRFMDQVWQS